MPLCGVTKLAHSMYGVGVLLLFSDALGLCPFGVEAYI